MIFLHKTHIWFFSFIFFSAFACPAQNNQDEGFELVKKDDNIFVHERWITFPKSSPPVRAREVKSEFHVNASIADALKLLQNESKIKEWQKHVSEFKVYPQRDTSFWFEYSYHDIPWPVSDQDHLLEYKIQESSTPEKVFVTFETITNKELEPVREDVARMVLSGSWLFETTSEGKTKITYRILSMPSSIPRIFTDPVIRSNLMSTIKNYIKILEKSKEKTSAK
jgi:hypothetical protein